MPIGKNAIKRAAKGGYSNITASAPDMENSVITVEEGVTDTKKKTAVKKASDSAKAVSKAQAKARSPKKAVEKASSTPKKSMEVEPELSPVKTAERVTKKIAKSSKRQGDGYVNLGGELPYYLL